MAVAEGDAEIAAIPPADVPFHLSSLEGDKRQPKPFIFGDGVVPAAVRVADVLRVSAGADKSLVSYANNVEIEIVERVAPIPAQFPQLAFGQVPLRWFRIIKILAPPGWVGLVDTTNARKIGPWDHGDAMP